MKTFQQLILENTVSSDSLTMSIPLFIRMLEYAKEDAKTDMDLHKATENMISIQCSGVSVLGMDNYNKIIS